MARKALHDDPVDLGWRMRREDPMVQITGEVREGMVHLLLPASEFLVIAGRHAGLGDERYCRGRDRRYVARCRHN